MAVKLSQPRGESGADPERVRRLLGAPGLARLLERLRRRAERGAALERGRLRLERVSGDERRAVERLLGRPPGQGHRISPHW